MWRALFLALGIMTVIVGVECLMIESATVYAAGESSARSFVDPTSSPAPLTRTISPGEFLPWALLSGGTIIVLYAFTLPKRWGNLAGE